MDNLVQFWLVISQAIATLFMGGMTLIIGYGLNAENLQGEAIGKLPQMITVVGIWAVVFVICSIRAWMLLKKGEKLRQAAIITSVPVLTVAAAVFLMT